MTSLFTYLAGIAAPAFLILSPILSYGDQIHSMHKNRSSHGFSLDIPLIMLVASFLRIFYYPGARFDVALLIQSFIMVVVQVILLKVALDHRPPPGARGCDIATPFANTNDDIFSRKRPGNFWQWKLPRPYWRFLLYLFIFLTTCELLLTPFHGIYAFYSACIGYMGLGIEATLPIPQIFANHRAKSCKGFRASVIASWIAGDGMKMFWFFTSRTHIPLAFKLSGMFQACCDCYLGLQYIMYGDGRGWDRAPASLQQPLPSPIPDSYAMSPRNPDLSSYGLVSNAMPMHAGAVTPRRSATPIATTVKLL